MPESTGAAVPLFASAITGAFTILGAVVASLFSARAARAERASQAQQRQTDLRLAKLEETYLLFEKWETAYANVYLAFTRCYYGKLTAQQAMDLTKQSEVLLPGEYQRLMMLINIHFPTLAADRASVEQARARITPFLDDPGKSGKRVSEFEQRQREFETVCREFKGKVAAHADRLSA